jgi:hypothetical protein
MPAIEVGAADPGESLVQVSASRVFLDAFIHHRPKEPVLLLAILIIAGLERFLVVVQDLPPVLVMGAKSHAAFGHGWNGNQDRRS